MHIHDQFPEAAFHLSMVHDQFSASRVGLPRWLVNRVSDEHIAIAIEVDAPPAVYERAMTIVRELAAMSKEVSNTFRTLLAGLEELFLPRNEPGKLDDRAN